MEMPPNVKTPSCEPTQEQEENEKAEDVQLRIDYIAGFVQPPDNSKFIQFGNAWVYPEAIKARKQLGFLQTRRIT